MSLRNLPTQPPDQGDTAIALEVKGTPAPMPWACARLWQGDAARLADWAST